MGKIENFPPSELVFGECHWSHVRIEVVGLNEATQMFTWWAKRSKNKTCFRGKKNIYKCLSCLLSPNPKRRLICLISIENRVCNRETALFQGLPWCLDSTDVTLRNISLISKWISTRRKSSFDAEGNRVETKAQDDLIVCVRNVTRNHGSLGIKVRAFGTNLRAKFTSMERRNAQHWRRANYFQKKMHVICPNIWRGCVCILTRGTHGRSRTMKERKF